MRSFTHVIGLAFGCIIVATSAHICTWHHNCDWQAMAIHGKAKVLRTPPPR